MPLSAACAAALDTLAQRLAAAATRVPPRRLEGWLMRLPQPVRGAVVERLRAHVLVALAALDEPPAPRR